MVTLTPQQIAQAEVWTWLGGAQDDSGGTAPNSTVYFGPVPAEQIWVVVAASVFGDDGTGCEYMIEMIHPQSYRICVAKTPTPVRCTPYLPLGRVVVLGPGWGLAARKCGGDLTKRVGLNVLYIAEAISGTATGPTEV